MTCRQGLSIQPRRSANLTTSAPAPAAPTPATSPQPICAAARSVTAVKGLPWSRARLMSTKTRKNGTARPSFRPLSTFRAWRTRDGTAWSVTTRWPSAASVDESMMASSATDAKARPGKISSPARVPATMVRGRPMSSSRPGQARWVRNERRSMRTASPNSRSARASSATRSQVDAPRDTLNQPSADGPTSRPAKMRTRAGVTPLASSGRETAP